MKQIIILIIFLLLSAFPQTAKADIFSDISQIQCIPELQLIEVKEYFIRGDAAVNALEESPDEIWQKYNIVARGRFRDEYTLPKERPLKRVCKLSENDTYEITIGTTREAGCHNHTLSLTVKYNGKFIIRDLPLNSDYNMFGQCDRPINLHTLEIHNADKAVVIVGEREGQYYHQTFFFDELEIEKHWSMSYAEKDYHLYKLKKAGKKLNIYQRN